MESWSNRKRRARGESPIRGHAFANNMPRPLFDIRLALRQAFAMCHRATAPRFGGISLAHMLVINVSHDAPRLHQGRLFQRARE